MKRFYLIFVGVFLCTCAYGANLRSSNATIRTEPQNSTTNARQTTNRVQSITTRTASTRLPTQRKNVTTRNAVKTVSARSGNSKTISARTTTTKKRLSRAATDSTVSTRTFGTNYTTCRDAYFTCMDQFCATQNTTYRRCICSSKLEKIQEQERSLSQTKNSLQDFYNFNIDAVSKTAAEVTAMQTASEGEQNIKEDKSKSKKQLKNIKAVLNKTKQNSLSTSGTLDIAGDIKSIWNTTDLIRGYDISTLSGEALYNAVNAQCYEIVKPQCTTSDLKMIASAYGMYIENDCEALAADITKKTTTANAAIRTTRHDLQDARLENYDAHNLLSINDCIAKVRTDITADTACGENYVHCLDVTGKYLDITTGTPIYSTSFYQFVDQISLSGDILKNSKNTAFVNLLNKKQPSAQQTLDLCRDISASIWDEFLRQALVEISQAQQQRVQQVKQDCLTVVNKCYLNKSNELKSYAEDVSNVHSRQALELSEQLCEEKLTTCSNLYGGGPEGLALLVSTMSDITDATIAQECPVLLNTYVQKICAVPLGDTEHSYPFGCRTYAPGEIRYAQNPMCNTRTTNPFEQSNILNTIIEPSKYTLCYTAYPSRKYISCNPGYYLNGAGNCIKCDNNQYCPGGTTGNPDEDNNYTDLSDLFKNCGSNYIGSLYYLLARYALQNCVRSSKTLDSKLPENILADIESVMTKMRSTLTQALSQECTKYNGIWVSTPWQDANRDGWHDSTGDMILQQFYIDTGTNPLWGYCKQY